MSTKKTSLLKEIRSDYAFATILKVNCVPTFLTHFRKLFFENNPKLFRVLLQRCHKQIPGKKCELVGGDNAYHYQQQHRHHQHALEIFTMRGLWCQKCFPNRHPGKCVTWWVVMMITAITNQQEHQYHQHDGHALEIFNTGLWCQDCFLNRYPGKCARWWVVMMIRTIANQQQHQYHQHALEIFIMGLWYQDCFLNMYSGHCVRWWMVMVMINITKPAAAPAPPA